MAVISVCYILGLVAQAQVLSFEYATLCMHCCIHVLCKVDRII